MGLQTTKPYVIENEDETKHNWLTDQVSFFLFSN